MWALVKQAPEMKCKLWWEIMYKLFKFEQPPSGCQNCWKVVVRPNTLQQLLDLEEKQERMKGDILGCKCGVETRAYVLPLYGGYFYARSLEEGLGLKDYVEAFTGLPGTLKRGCTEYEMELGDSKEWHFFDKQLELEAEIERQAEIEEYTEQSDQERQLVHGLWEKATNDRADIFTAKIYQGVNPARCREWL